MQGEEAEGNFPGRLMRDDGQDGDRHSEASGDTPVMVHGTTELEGFDEVSCNNVGVPCCFAKRPSQGQGSCGCL